MYLIYRKMPPEIRLRSCIFNYFLKYFTPDEIVDILQDLIVYFQSHNAHQLYDVIHNNN